jgi:hypothetical protein
LNKAERALRRAASGAPARAVYILNRWTAEQRECFRKAYLAEDWKSVQVLCMVDGATNTPPDRKVLIHLMDATAPERDGW